MVGLLQAIAREEGFYIKGTRANRNNNPGNLEFGCYAKAHGAEKSDGRFAIFPSVDAGFAALHSLLSSSSYRDLTLEEAIARYAPSNENDTARYVKNVCSWTGFHPSTPLKECL